MSSARKVCLSLLLKMDRDMSYSNILLNDALASSDLTLQNKRFASSLFYGVLERKLTLDYIISKYSQKPIDKLHNEVKQILRMGIYQLLYMNSVPDSAAVNESCNLAKERHMISASGFINAVLRSFIRSGLMIPKSDNDIENISIEYSCPTWLCEKWINEYGYKTAIVMLKASLSRPPITVKVNTITSDALQLQEQLNKEEIENRQIDIIDNCIEVFSPGSLENTKAYKMGLFHVQDLSSQLCCRALDVREGQTVLDLCAAPGGKSFTIAQHMNNTGKIISCDLHEKRVKLIRDGALRLKLTNIDAIINNAKVFNMDFPLCDRILCDVPCSGLGVIRRKPEIKYKNPSDFDGLPQIQYDILETASRYLKTDGIIVYSTCTVSRTENDDIIKKFLDEHRNFEGVEISKEYGKAFSGFCATVTPDFNNCDGFFIAKLRKMRD